MGGDVATMQVRDRAEFGTEEAARQALPGQHAGLPYLGVWRQGSGDAEVWVHVFTDDPDADPATFGWIPLQE